MGFCPNCGKQLADGETCNCTATQSKVSKKLLTGIIAAVAVVVAVVVLILVLGAGGYKKPVDALTKAVNSHVTSVDKLASAALPGFAESAYKKAVKVLKSSDDVKDAIKEAEESLEEVYDDMDDEYGKGWKVVFDYGKGEKVDKDDFEDIADTYSALYDSFFEDAIDEIKDFDKYDYEDMADSLDIKVADAKSLCKTATDFMSKFEECKVTGAYELTGRLIIQDKKGKTVEKSDKITVRVIKLNGDWMIDYLGLADEMGYSINYLIRMISSMM